MALNSSSSHYLYVIGEYHALSHACEVSLQSPRGLKLGSLSPTVVKVCGYCLPGISSSLLTTTPPPNPSPPPKPLPLRNFSFSIPLCVSWVLTNPVPCFAGLRRGQACRYRHKLKLGVEGSPLTPLRLLA